MERTNLQVAIIVLILIIIALGVGLVLGLKDDTTTKEQLWVAVGNDDVNFGNIMWSPDGKKWTQTTTGHSFASLGNGVAYGNDRWVAVGNNTGGGGTCYGNVMWSDDGKNWTQTTSGASILDQGYGVAYGTSDGSTNLWVAVGDSTDSSSGAEKNIMSSPDGKTWTYSTGDFFRYNGSGVAYGTSDGTTNQLWVAVGNTQAGIPTIMHSDDGKEWTWISSGLCFDGGIDSSASAYYGGNGVAYGTSDGTNQLWVAVGDNTTTPASGISVQNILYSETGKVWLFSSGASFRKVGYGVAYGTSDGTATNQLWVAVGDNAILEGGAKNGNIMYSEDGKNWTQSDASGASFDTTGRGVTYSEKDNVPLWVAVGDDLPGGTSFGNILYSSNGKTWTATSSGASFATIGYAVASDY